MNRATFSQSESANWQKTVTKSGNASFKNLRNPNPSSTAPLGPQYFRPRAARQWHLCWYRLNIWPAQPNYSVRGVVFPRPLWHGRKVGPDFRNLSRAFFSNDSISFSRAAILCKWGRAQAAIDFGSHRLWLFYYIIYCTPYASARLSNKWLVSTLAAHAGIFITSQCIVARAPRGAFGCSSLSLSLCVGAPFAVIVAAAATSSQWIKQSKAWSLI